MSYSNVNDFNTNVKEYYKNISKTKPLSQDKEKDLLIKAKDNNISAKNEIITSNLKFVFDVAKKYKGCGVELDELISEGNLGLVKAIEKFDTSKDVKFITYAVFWIKSYIQEYIKSRYKTFSHEVSEDDEFNHFSYECGIYDEYDDVATKGDALLYSKINENEFEIDESKIEVINELIKKLSVRGQFVIKYYFGIGLKRSFKIEEIAQMLNLTPQRICKIKDVQLRILRSELLLNDEYMTILKN